MSEMYCPNCNRAHTASGACRCVDPLGFSPERLARGEADAEAGRVRPLEEVMEALRARILESESAALAVDRLREENTGLREALISVVAHTGLPPLPSLDLTTGLLESIARIANAALTAPGGDRE